MRISDWSSDVCSSDLVAWIKAHPERRDPTSRTWSADEWGNWAADQLASTGTIPLGQAQIFHISYSELLQGIHYIVQGKPWDGEEIGRASCRERVCQYV